MLLLLLLAACIAVVVIAFGVFIASRSRGNARTPSDVIPTYTTQNPLLHLPDSVKHDVQALAQRGEKIAAIKLLRDHTQVGLKEAKAYVEQLDRAPAGEAPPPSIRACSPEELEELRLLARQGKKIEAIKRYREITGTGLKEAKDAVEGL